jgi:hypothetical protein
MAAKRRVGKTRTFGISVDVETERFLRAQADALFGGNVSRLVTALALEEKSRQAAARLLRDSRYEPMTDVEAGAFAAQFRARRKQRKTRAA